MTITSINFGIDDNGDPPNIFFAKVNHKFTNEHHVFTSESIPGLFIAEKDADKALKQIIPTIQKLVFMKTGMKVTVKPGKDFKDFKINHHSKKTTSIEDSFFVIENVKVA